MKQSSKRFLSMILAFAFIVAAFVVFFDLIQPTYADLQSLKAEQLSSKSFIENEQTIVSQVKKLVSQYGNDSAAAQSLALAMPSGPDVAGALAQVYGIATNNGLTVRSISISSPMAQLQGAGAANQILKPAGQFSFQVGASGSYENMKSFLAQLETNIRIFNVTSLTLQPVAQAGVAGAATTTDQFTYSFMASTYYQLQ